MATNTNISWVDSTFNPWWGCSKVSPACDNCYAETLDLKTGGNHWGEGTKPRIMSPQNWNNPIRWQRDAEAFFKEHNRNRRVFCGSMCDWADKNAPEGQRDRLWSVINKTSDLDWLLLTKRAPNIKKYLAQDWCEGYENVWLGVSVEDIKHGKPRIDTLRDIPAKIRFLSVEPLLEDLGTLDLEGIHWVIVGGETGTGHRKMELEWVYSIEEQCKQQGVTFFFKQTGDAIDNNAQHLNGRTIHFWPKSPRTCNSSIEQPTLI